MPDNPQTGWGGPAAAAPDLPEVRAAATRVADVATRTHLAPLHSYADSPDTYLKPETLQPIGSFKLRGVYNWASSLSPEERNRGLSTTSAGNTAQALGYVARLFGTTARTVVPDWLPDNKLQSIINYGATPIKVPSHELMAFMLEERWKQEPYAYLNPWGEPAMIAGHGTIGLEIFADLPDVDTVFVPVGGGALVCGIGSVLKALNPDIRIVGVQSEVNPALAEAFRNGGPVWIDWKPPICEGASTPLLAAEMYPLLRPAVDEAALVSEADARAAIKRLALGNKLVAEGAGAISVAAALAEPQKKRGKAVCIVSGGSIDPELLASILADVVVQ